MQSLVMAITAVSIFATIGLIIVVIVKRKIYRSPSKLIVVILCLVLFPIATDGVSLLAALGTGIHQMMLFSCVFKFALPLAVASIAESTLRKDGEKRTPTLSRKGVDIAHRILSWMIVVPIFLLSWSNYLYINEGYTKQSFSIAQTIQFSERLYEDIVALDGYEAGMSICRVGYYYPSTQIPTYNIYNNSLNSGPSETWIINMYSYGAFVSIYLNEQLAFTAVNDEALVSKCREQLEAMPKYPAKGSVRIIDGVVYVKLGELPEK
jgi:hypothetical protein